MNPGWDETAFEPRRITKEHSHNERIFTSINSSLILGGDCLQVAASG